MIVLTVRRRTVGPRATLIAHRLADPDPIVTRAGTTRRPERSHQLDATGATGAGSLRIQDTYRVDPNEVRTLPAGVAYVVTGGRAAKVAISRGGQALPAGPSRRCRRADEIVGPGDPALVCTSDGAEETEQILSALSAADHGAC